MMQFLTKYNISLEFIKKLENKYDKSMIQQVLYKEDEVCLIIEYLKDKGFVIENILLNRLDIFLLDFNYIKNKIDNIKDSEMLQNLKDDFSLFEDLR